jgi:hypothetical protein
VLVFFAGCSESSLPLPQTALRSAIVPSLVVRQDRAASWMMRDAASHDLLYVSIDGFDDVYVYDYTAGHRRTLVGKLTGFDAPGGLCVDKKGDVFVANYLDEDVVEYAHGGTKPIATLKEPNYRPIACTIDPTTGDLAVTATSPASGRGTIAVYQHAQGAPKQYYSGHLEYTEFLGYDNAGNLFADGIHFVYEESGCCFYFGLAELAKDAKRFERVQISKYGDAGDLQWDGQYMALGNRANGVEQLKITNYVATVVGSTTLDGTRQLAQFWVQGTKVIGADAGYAAVDFWDYPAGGKRLGRIAGLYNPFGVAVSPSR